MDGKQKDYAYSTLKAHWVVLNGAFKYAIYPTKYINDNPMIYVVRKKINRNLETFLDVEESSTIKTLEQDIFNKILELNKDTIYYLSLMIAYHTGARPGEICGISWDDVNLNSKTIRINKSMFYNAEKKRWELGKTKNGKPRTFDFGDTLYQLLKAEQKKQLADKLYYGTHYKNIFYDVVKEEGLSHIILTNESNHTTSIDFVCKKKDGDILTNQTLKYLVKRTKNSLGIDFHFHMIRPHMLLF